MSLTAGTRLGAYEIRALLGSGGMGEVYRARDTKLGRDVALKTLPASFTFDTDRLARLRREAQVLAALTHPHIGSIYGIEEAHGFSFLVLELIDGETLADRIRMGALPVDEAIAVATEIAEALQAAHAKGIVHRDLKPANIALTGEGRVKVLDFGLAKPPDVASGSDGPELMNSPTVTSPTMVTGMGVILGTAPYMSPEQAKGRVADKRTDVWAFGCVLYEMLTGRRAFEGDDVSDVLASVLKTDPDWRALPASLPVAIRELLDGCLKKDPRERIADISTALFVLKHPRSMESPVPPRQAGRRSMWTAALLMAVGIVAGAAGAALISKRAPLGAAPVTRFAFRVAEGREMFVSRPSLAISPDGSRIVYSAGGRLFLRLISEFDSRPLPTPDPAIHPVFAPDGQSIVYWSDPGLKRIAVTGGVPVTICQTTPAPFGISWANDAILFVEPGVGIRRVSANGGVPVTVVRVTPADGLAHGPQLLPDGDTLLFTLARVETPSGSFWDKGQIVAQSLRTGTRKILIERGSDAHYVRTGHIVYAIEGTIVAVPFNLQKLEVTGGPVPVIEGVRRAAATGGGQAQLAFSDSGALVYLSGPSRSGQDNLFLFDRKGNAQPLKLPPGLYSYPRVSPDGKWLAFETADGKEAMVSLYDLSGSTSVRRLTFGGNNRLPIWSADGRRVAFQSDREGDRAIFWQSVAGGSAERLTRPESGVSHVPETWSPRGDDFLFSATKGTTTTLWTFSMRNRTTARFDDVASTVFPTDAVFSPDGRWVAYQTGDVGTGEATTYVQPYPPNGTKFQIGRGGRPVWSRDGREILLVPGPGQFAAIPVRTTPSFAFSDPVALPRRFGLAPPAGPRPYDIVHDGRILAAANADQLSERMPEIQVVLNWFDELKAKAPVR